MPFVDEVTVFATGGRGGNGSASLHSEPYKPLGGVDGGTGGNGGSVVFEVSSRARDLSWLADHPHQEAASGGPGRKSHREGATGKDLVILVPDGTVVSDQQGLIADLVGEGARAVVARGGRGGRGNAALASGKNRVPKSAEQGEEGEERRLKVELRTVADVGLVGLPNAGKSTLLSRLTAAKPKIADYPFTTLTPNLGVAGSDEDRFVVADIPGLVQGAAGGKGLGHRFLRHIVRCRALLLVVDLSGEDPAADLATLREELAAYDPALAERPALIVGTKADLIEEPDGVALGPEALVVSAVNGLGLPELLERIGVLASQASDEAPERKTHVVIRPARPSFTITREQNRFRVSGRNVERWVVDTDMNDETEVADLQKRLKKEGVERRLAEAGARRSDDVVIGSMEFEFLPEEDERGR